MSLFGTLYTGVTGLNAAELQIATTGNNITNSDSVFYTRQRVVQQTAGSLKEGGVNVGVGTSVATIKRLHDEFSYDELKNANVNLEFTKTLSQTLQQASQAFPDIKGTGILQYIENYNAAWNNFASNPTDSASKVNLVQSASILTDSINKTYQALDKLQGTMNDQIKLTVDEINSIGEEIAGINKQLSGKEILNPDNANGLRDKRDELELRLSKLVKAVASKQDLVQGNTFSDITTTTSTDHGYRYNLSIQGFSIVDGSNFHPLKIDDKNQQQFFSIYYEQSDEKRFDLTDRIQGGQLGAQLQLRGTYFNQETGVYSNGILQGYKNTLSTFAKTLITQTNNIYARSATDSISSETTHKLKPNNALSSFDKSIQPGTFDVVVYDDAGKEVAKRPIKIDINTTIEDVVAQINANMDDNNNNNTQDDVDDFFSAMYSYEGASTEGQFSINPKQSGYKIALQDNGTNFPGALNVSGFFGGHDANTIRVNEKFTNDSSLLSASSSGMDGNNDVANDMLQLQHDQVKFYNQDGTVDTMTLENYYRELSGTIASDGQSATFTNKTNETVYNASYAEFQSKNGVNVNEELASLIKYQSSYGAAAKIVTTIDQMLDTLLGLKQ